MVYPPTGSQPRQGDEHPTYALLWSMAHLPTLPHWTEFNNNQLLYNSSTTDGERYDQKQDRGLPLKVVTGTCVTSVYNLLGESSSSFLFRARRTRTRWGTCLQPTQYKLTVTLHRAQLTSTAGQPVVCASAITTKKVSVSFYGTAYQKSQSVMFMLPEKGVPSTVVGTVHRWCQDYAAGLEES